MIKGIVITGGDRRESAAMVDGRSEPRQGIEVLGHAVTHMALESIARMRQAEPRHQAVARHLGDNRGSRDRRHKGVTADNRIAVASDSDAIAAIDQDELRARWQRCDRACQRP